MFKLRSGFENSLASQLLIVIFGLYFAVTVIVTAVQLSAEYYHVKSTISKEIRLLPETFEKGIKISLWRFNHDLLHAILIGINKLPVISGTKVVDEKGRQVKAIGTIIDDKGNHVVTSEDEEQKILGRNERFLAELYAHSFPLVHIDADGEIYNIGSWIVYSSQRIVIERIQYGFVLILVNSVIKTLALWFIFLTVIRIMLGKPLEQLRTDIERIRPDNLDKSKITIKTKEKNELKIVEKAFNTMIENLYQSRQKIDQVNLHLEELVEQRTEELKNVNQELQRKHDEQQAIFTAFPDLYFWLKSDGTIIGYQTDQMSDLYVSPEQFMGNRIQDVLPPEIGKLFQEAIDKILQGRAPSVSIEYMLSVYAGEKYFEARHLPLPEDKIIVIVRDITERKRSEAEIKKYSENLEAMVEVRTEELRKAQEELIMKERLAVIGHFAGSISHELRNPLAVIENSAYLLKMKLGHSDEKIVRNLEFISGNVKKSTSIIQSLLNLSRMEKPMAENSNLTDLISETLHSSKIPASVEVDLHLPEKHTFVFVEAEQIRMALKNIIKNAIQAMSGKGKLTISVQHPDSGLVELKVTDTGLGIASEHTKKIFEPLFTTKTNGIGFGLSITKMIVENHGGSVLAESEAGLGAVFIINLPIAQTQV